MARLLVGSLDPAKVPALSTTTYTPADGVARTTDKWGRALKLGNEFVSSNLGRGLMDAGVAGVGGLVDTLGSTSFGDASQDMPEGDTSGMDAVASAAQAKLGITPSVAPAPSEYTKPSANLHSPPTKMMPGAYKSQAYAEAESKLGSEYTKLMETAERSPDPKVVAAVDKRMRAIEAQLAELRVKQESLSGQPPGLFDEARWRDVGKNRRREDGMHADVGDTSFAERPPAGSSEMADAMARGMSSYTAQVAAQDEQGTLEAEMADRELARGKSIDQTLGRKRPTELGNLTPGQAWQRAVDVYQEMFEDATKRGDVKEIARTADLLQSAKRKVSEYRATASGTDQERADQSNLLNRLQVLDPGKYGSPPTGVTSESQFQSRLEKAGSVAPSPAGKFAPPLPGMKVQSVTNRPGGEEGVYYSDDYTGDIPQDKTPPQAEPKTKVETEKKKDPFDVQMESLQGKSPSNQDVLSLASMADTAEKKAKVYQLSKQRSFRPSSLFDFTGGGEEARFNEQLRKTFPKDKEMTEYQALTLEEKRAARGEQTKAREERTKLANEKMAWARQKWEDYKKMQAGRLKAARGRKGGDPTKPLKDQDRLLKDVEDTASRTIGELDKEEQEADKAARKARDEYGLAEAGVVNVPVPKKPSDPDDPEQAKAYESKLEKYREAQAKQAVAEKRKTIADDAEKEAAEIKARNKELKESIKADRDAARKAREGIRNKLGISLPKSEPKAFSPYLSK